ncbi:DUF11 domain-containing protein [Paenibacillus sp. 481]|uniref:DUF11 domain-containing protein n=1 Tax=Paenibacillus sp. 481 TaxID=2835869 RepID=UPI001E49FFB5|nr:DUF11 domain-containing protein [Paenibacillus sp. 481]UHA72685.1 DUF11 domain-containing protein [Paenibacillus sp. 481]
MPFVQRFTTTSAGSLTFTGNALSLSKIANQLLPGTLDASGAFITTNTSLVAPGWFPGTTLDFTVDNSAAILQLPPGSTVEYAELIWSANYANPTGNVTPLIANPIQFTTPLGTFTITREQFFDNVGANGITRWYTQTANVTALVQAAGAGTYVTGSVPAVITPDDNQSSHSGWTLAVSYQNAAQPFRNKSIFVGQDLVGITVPRVDIAISGFSSPAAGPVTGRILLSAHDGDPFAGGDIVQFGPNTTILSTLSGPNNLANNFFQAQINNDSGNLDTSGTFGTRNATAGNPGFYNTGSRLGYDITNVDGSAGLRNSQTSGVLRITTTSDVILPNGVGIQIDVNQPIISVVKSSDRTVVQRGDTITYTVVVTNSGAASADNVILRDTIPTGTTFVDGSVTIDTVQQPGASPVSGINLGTLPLGMSRRVTFQLRVGTGTVPPQFIDQASTTFQFQTVPGGPVLDGVAESGEVVVNLLSLNVIKTANPTEVAPGNDVLYTISVINNGGVPVTDVVVTDTLLGIDEFVSVLPAGETLNFQISFPVPPDTPAGTVFTNTASAVSNEIAAQATAQTTVIAAPALVVTKLADRTVVAVGETVTYTIEVVNAGNSTLTNVRVTDAQIGVDTVIPQLLQGASQFVFGEFTVPLNASGTFTNTVTVVANETGPVSASETVTITAQPNLFIRKTANQPTVEAGQEVMFEIEVGNAGNNILTNIRVQDPLLGIDQTINELVPGESFNFTGSITPSFGTAPGTVITNTVTATSDQIGPVSDEASVTVLQPTLQILEVIKEADQTTAAPGSTITYTIFVSNTGFINITNVRVTDPLLGIDQTISLIFPAETIVLNGTFVVPLDTPDGTNITNTVTATSDQTVPAQSTNVVPIQSTFELEIVKTANVTSALPGEVVTYTITVTNTGNMTLTNLNVTDARLDLDQTVTQLLAGAAISFTQTFTIPAETPAGTTVDNVSQAVADRAVLQEAAASVAILAAPLLTITKEADITSAAPGSTITYTINVKNGGNVPLTNVRVQDLFLGLDQTFPTLGIGGVQTIILTFSVPVATPAETVFINTATAVSDQTAQVTAQARVIVSPIVGLVVAKSVSPTSAPPGGNVVYTIVVSNTSGTTLNNIVVADVALSFIQTIPTLAPGASQTLTVPFTIPLNRLPESFTNTALATANETDTVSGSATVTVLQLPVLLLTKDTSVPSAVPGETIRYNITLFNPGNVALTNVRIIDPLLGIDTIINLLDLGLSINLNVPFEIPRSFVGSSLTNTVVVETGELPDEEATNVLPIVPDPIVTFTKNADRATAAPGETIHYVIVINNTSSVPLTNIFLFDPVIKLMERVTRLDPGQSISFNASFTVPKNTLAGTVIRNEAVLTSDDSVTQRASATVTVSAAPAVILTKTASKNTAFQGEQVQFVLNFLNAGNVPLTNVRAVDPLLNINLFNVRVPVGTTRQARLPFVIPANAVPGSTIVNTITLTSNELAPVSASASIQVLASPLQVIKSADRLSAITGEIVTFTIRLKNTSVFELTNIKVFDEIPAGTELVVGSVTINGKPSASQNLRAGVPIHNLKPGEEADIRFKVKIQISPNPPIQAVNQASVLFSFRNAQGTLTTLRVFSNQVVILIEEMEE